MSSIERAMDKLGGVDSDDEGESKIPLESASPETLPGSSEDSVASSPLSAEQPAPAEQDTATEETAERESPAAPTPSPQAAVAASVAPAANAPSAQPQPPEPTNAPRPNSANYINLDFERLAAAGHLVPEASVITRASEEYQQIKRRLLGNMVEGILSTPRPKNLIMVTSSLPSEGKTFTSVNLALSLTMEVDHTILAVDTDIVKRDLSRAFGVEGYRGLYDLLGSDTLRLEDLLVRTSIPNLVLLPAGQDRDASTERLASAQMRALTDELASRYSDRVVLFDSPPILATTTATALAPLVGQLMIVVEASRTKQETVRESLSRLEGIRITGMILNKSKQQATRAYDYYGYYYRPE